jgi:cell fate (sporulation/competence/biofilm development) regulator YlbF (YheA/YmcA/DUF963 family)
MDQQDPPVDSGWRVVARVDKENRMSDQILNELELAPPEVVRQAARDFAQALAETPQFKALEAADERLRGDAAAQGAMQAFQAKQQGLQMMQMLNAVSAEEAADLEHLRQAFLAAPAVAAYLQAQEDFTALCRAAADLLSKSIGLSFSAACGPGCC